MNWFFSDENAAELLILLNFKKFKFFFKKKDNQTITEEALIEAVNKFAIDVTLDPAEVSVDVLRKMILRKTGNKDDFISVKLFKYLFLKKKKSEILYL